MSVINSLNNIFVSLNNRGWVNSISDAVENNNKTGLIIIRLGGYKRLNAQFGYKGCNEAIRQVVSYLRQIVPGHKVYRLNMLHYGCVVPGGQAEAVKCAEKIQDVLSHGFVMRGYKDSVKIPFKMMLAEAPTFVKRVEDTELMAQFLLDEPDVHDTDHIREVTEADFDIHMRKLKVGMSLDRSIREASFEVVYQPIVRLSDMKIYSVEALSRIKDDESNLIYPNEFIPAAEDYDVVSYITDCVFRRAANLMKSGGLMDKGVSRMHINICASEVKRLSTAGRLGELVTSGGFDSYVMCLEISETASPIDKTAVGEGIMRLHDAGLGIVLDDYGTGYSNIIGIVSLPIALVKIDMSFLRMAMKDEKIMVMLRDVVEMIHHMERKVLVAGVEDKECYDAIKDLGVDYAQGFYFCKPVGEKELIEYIDNVNNYGVVPFAV